MIVAGRTTAIPSKVDKCCVGPGAGDGEDFIFKEGILFSAGTSSFYL